MAESLFDKYGGVPVVTRIVRDFYRRVMRRPNLRRYFEDVPVEKVIRHQIGFVSYAMGKPMETYVGRDLHGAHLGHDITHASFSLFIELFADALREEHVTEPDIEKILHFLKRQRESVVTR